MKKMLRYRLLAALLGSSPVLAHELPRVGTSVVQVRITGAVRARDGEQLPGVSVVLKGTNTGTITDARGEYALTLPDGTGTLVFSYVGYLPQEVPVSNRDRIDVTLEADVKALGEVVVVGYGTQKKVNLTGAVASIDAKQIENRPITNIAQALQGQVPGLLVTQTGGRPGAESIGLRIRGVSTFTGNDPLVIVDGIAISLASINPNDIESISVLKDAAATAIYGARASGGVILVTTKKGKTGQTRVSYDGYVGVQSPTMMPDMVNAYEHALLYREGEKNNNPTTTTFRFSEEQIEKYRTGALPTFDRPGYLFRPAPQTQHNLSVSGGTENASYFVSLGYLNQQGTMRNTGFERFNLRVNNTFKVGKRLDIGVIAQFAPTVRSGPSEANYPSGPTRGIGDIIFSAFRRAATNPMFLPDGRWASIGGFANRIGMASPDGGFQKQQFSRFTGALNFTYTILEGLSVNALYSGKFDQTRQDDFSKRMKFYNAVDEGKIGTLEFDLSPNVLTVFNQANYQHNLQFLLNFDRQFGVHEVKVLGGFTQEWNNDRQESVGRRDFLTDDIYVINAGSQDTKNWTSSGSASAWAIRSLFGRVNYVLNGKYLFEANLRYDGSSRFAQPVRWGLFPSASAGWRISEEAFLKNNTVVNNLKLRASWGQVGNQNVALYQYAATIGTSAYFFDGQSNPTAFYQGSPNPNLTWETKTTANLGVDAEFFRGKLALTADVFQDRTRDILLTPPVPDTYGQSAPVQNIGIVQNRGWELALSHRNSLGAFRYSVGVQISDAKDKVIDMVGSPVISGNKITEIGYPLNTFFGWQANGFFQTAEEVKAHSFQNVRTGPGDIRYVENGGDPKTITADDRVRLGNSNPRYPYGFNLELGWKGFDFTAFAQGVAYRQVYLNSVAAISMLDENASAMKVHLDRWTPETPDARYPKTRLGNVSNINNAFSSFWLQDAAYLRLKNLQLGYTLPTRLSERVKLARARIYFSAENLFTISNVVGFDPESPEGNGSFYPLNKVATLGLNLSL